MTPWNKPYRRIIEHGFVHASLLTRAAKQFLSRIADNLLWMFFLVFRRIEDEEKEEKVDEEEDETVEGRQHLGGYFDESSFDAV